jgi:hypothetical protein
LGVEKMALDRAAASKRFGVAYHPQWFARATRLRVLRLEHDPQPGLDGNACARPRFFERRRPDGRSRLVSLDVLNGRRPFHQDAVASSGAVFGCPPMGSKPIVEAGEPVARTRQIQIRNRQRHLHTAAAGVLASEPVRPQVFVPENIRSADKKQA